MANNSISYEANKARGIVGVPNASGGYTYNIPDKSKPTNVPITIITPISSGGSRGQSVVYDTSNPNKPTPIMEGTLTETTTTTKTISQPIQSQDLINRNLPLSSTQSIFQKDMVPYYLKIDATPPYKVGVQPEIYIKSPSNLLVKTGSSIVVQPTSSLSESTAVSSSSSDIFHKGFQNMELYKSNLLAEQNTPIKNYSPDILQQSGVPSTWGGVFKSYSRGAELFGIGAVQAISAPFLYPRETWEGFKYQFTHPIKSAERFGGELVTDPAGTLGGVYGTSQLFNVAGKGIKLGRDVSIRVTSKNVPLENYLDVPSALKVSEGESAFPTASSINDALKQFGEGKTDIGTFKILSASPEPISFFKQSRYVAVGKGTGVGRTEGLYAAPSGKGSSYFFSIGKESGYDLSILPKVGTRPTLSQIEVGSIERIPKTVLSQGVASENLFLQTQGIAGTNKAFISGNLERAFNPGLKGWSTSESEVIIPAGSIMKQSSGGVFGYSESFSFMGRRIPVRNYRLVSEDLSVSKSFDFKNPFTKEGKYVQEGSTMKYYEPASNISLTGSYVAFSSIGSFKYSRSSYVPSYSSSGRSYSVSSVSYSPSLSYKYSSSLSLSRKYSSYSLRSSSSSIKYYGSSSLTSSSNKYGSSYSYSNTVKPPYVPILKIRDESYNNKGGVKSSYRPSKKSRSKVGYFPSIEAGLFNIRTSKGVNLKQAYSGLTLRPIKIGGG